MKTDGSGSLQEGGAAALELMEKALGHLDQCNAPADIGAHLDLAIQRLRSLIAPQFLETGRTLGFSADDSGRLDRGRMDDA